MTCLERPEGRSNPEGRHMLLGPGQWDPPSCAAVHWNHLWQLWSLVGNRVSMLALASSCLQGSANLLLLNKRTRTGVQRLQSIVHRNGREGADAPSGAPGLSRSRLTPQPSPAGQLPNGPLEGGMQQGWAGVWPRILSPPPQRGLGDSGPPTPRLFSPCRAPSTRGQAPVPR